MRMGLGGLEMSPLQPPPPPPPPLASLSVLYRQSAIDVMSVCEPHSIVTFFGFDEALFLEPFGRPRDRFSVNKGGCCCR